MLYLCRILRTFRPRNSVVSDFGLFYNVRVGYSSKEDHLGRSSSQEYSALPPDDADVFGTLKAPLEPSPLTKASVPAVSNLITEGSAVGDEGWSEDEWSEESDKEIDYINRKSAQQYVMLMKQLCKEKKLKEALELYSQMKEERVYPKKFIYTYLIGACGRAGYTKMAFKLFKQMRDRGMVPSPATLTGLFNACAESPFPQHALEKAHSLRERIIENSWLPSTITYHAMIKAFGKCGDLKTAFVIVDEMKREGHSLTDETFAFLLMSCISDKEAGFTHAVQVFRKMKKFRARPSKYIYNLLLRAVRDCGVGSPETATTLLLDWAPQRRPMMKNLIDENKENKLHREVTLSDNKDEPSDAVIRSNIDEKKDIVVPNIEPTKLNLLSSRPLLSENILGLNNIQGPQDRLAIIGGVEGVLSSMKRYGIQPDIKTISILLDCIPSTTEAENSLLMAIDKYEIKPDVDFFNLLIKRRNYRRDFKGALEVLDVINKYNLKVDIVTYGVLALGCPKLYQGKKLMNDMEVAGISPSIEIMGALLRQAQVSRNFKYILDVMHAMKKFDVMPNSRCLQILENSRKMADEIQLKKDKGEDVNEKHLKWCKIFCLSYKTWLRSVKVELPQHPWNQYRVKI